MAITINQAQQALSWPTFLARVKYQMCIQALAVYSEPNTTVGHTTRAARATAILNNPDAYVGVYAQAVITQLSLSGTNLVGNTDLDTPDATLATEISAVWNALAGV